MSKALLPIKLEKVDKSTLGKPSNLMGKGFRQKKADQTAFFKEHTRERKGE